MHKKRDDEGFGTKWTQSVAFLNKREVPLKNGRLCMNPKREMAWILSHFQE